MGLTPDQAVLVVEDHDCLNCHALPGSACRPQGGKTVAGYHTPRFVLVPVLREELEIPVPANRAPGRDWKQGPALTVVPDPRTEWRVHIDRRDMFSRLTADGVVWSDGTKEAVDAIVFATGHRPTFPYLASSGALNETGTPRHRGGVSTAAPGLGFVGMEFQRSFSSKRLRGVGRDAGYLLQRLSTARR